MEIRVVEAFVWMGNGQMGPDDVSAHKGIPAALNRQNDVRSGELSKLSCSDIELQENAWLSTRFAIDGN
jgi:hypothetical protein